MWIIVVIVGVVLLYVFVLRERVKAFFPSFYAWIEPIESALWAKSKTILVARLTTLGGIGAGIANVTGTIDWNGVLSALVSWVPAQYQQIATLLVVPLAVAALGGIFEWLRRVTTAPVDAKE